MMPGICGIVSGGSVDSLERRSQAGLDRLVRSPWHRSKLVIQPPVALGVVLREGKLAGADLWVDPNSDIIVAIDGELYYAPSLAAGDSKHLPRFPTSECAEYIAALYRERGDAWVEAVRGAFAVAILDRASNSLMLYVDRYGLRPLHYAQRSQGLVFGSSMAAITAACPSANWHLNLDAVADWFGLLHVLGDKTFLRDVAVMPSAGILRYEIDSGLLSLFRYWSAEQVTPLGEIDFDEAAREACRLFGQAIDEQVGQDERVGVYLTGGLDSRTIAGFLHRRHISFDAFTYGDPGHIDTICARAIAKKTASHHYLFDLEPGDWVWQYADRFLASTESFASCFNSHGISTCEDARSRIDVHLSGIGGGSFAGGDTTSAAAIWARSHRHRAEEMYWHYVRMGNAFRTEYEREHLFSPSIRPEMAGRSHHSFDQAFAPYAQVQSDAVGDLFTLENRYKKFFAYCIAAERDFFELRCPFMDYRFLDFIFSLPSEWRLHRNLQLGMLDVALPELTLIPWEATESLPTRRAWLKNAYDLPSLAWRKLVRLLPGYQPKPYAQRDFPRWLRDCCMPWAREVLASEQLAEHRILDRDHLLDLLQRVPAVIHRSIPYYERRTLTNAIGAAISFELMCRRVLDGEP